MSTLELPVSDDTGARLLSDAREIAFPRYPGSEGDRQATAIVTRKFRDAGLEVHREEFSYDIRLAFRAIRLVLIAAAVLIGAGGATAGQSVAAALTLVLVALLVGGVLLIWSPGAERLYAKAGPTRTHNVTGYRRCSRPRLSLIFMAHHDSKSQNLSFPFRMGFTLLSILGALGLLALLVAAVLRGALPGPAWLAAALGGTAAVSLLALSTLKNGNHSPGGVDNAGSVAILFELARTLPREMPDDVELLFLSPGAEEDHMVGAMRWLEIHRDDFEGRPLYALNLDGAGAPGKTVFLERYGLARLFSRTLSRAARDSARRMGISYRGITLPPAMGVDAIPFAHHGVECLTFSSGSLDKATIAVHSSRDVVEHLDGDTLVRIASLVRSIALDLAAV